MSKKLVAVAVVLVSFIIAPGANANSYAQILAKAKVQVSPNSGKYQVKKVAASPLQYSTDTPEGSDPEHLEFRFANEKAVLNIYSIEGANLPSFKKNFPPYPASIADLSKILKNKPNKITDMPLIPWFEGVSSISAHLAYGVSKSGEIKYARLLQFFQQDAREVTNDELAYYAQGLTKDKKFYVSLECHVHAPGLKDKPPANWSKKEWNEFEKKPDFLLQANQ